jgi:hypothetical protein
MLKGKIIQDGFSHPNCDYHVKVGSVSVDITDEVRVLIAQESAKACAASEQALADLRAEHANIVDRYNQIERIVLAGGVGMPTA